jgi:hypothetical protein
MSCPYKVVYLYTFKGVDNFASYNGYAVNLKRNKENKDALQKNGANIVVQDLSELL